VPSSIVHSDSPYNAARGTVRPLSTLTRKKGDALGQRGQPRIEDRRRVGLRLESSISFSSF
jgi:hypothetical protein